MDLMAMLGNMFQTTPQAPSGPVPIDASMAGYQRPMTATMGMGNVPGMGQTPAQMAGYTPPANSGGPTLQEMMKKLSSGLGNASSKDGQDAGAAQQQGPQAQAQSGPIKTGGATALGGYKPMDFRGHVIIPPHVLQALMQMTGRQ